MYAALGGMTSPFLSAAVVSTEKVVEVIELMRKQIEVAFFAAGIFKLDETVGVGLRPTSTHPSTPTRLNQTP